MPKSSKIEVWKALKIELRWVGSVSMKKEQAKPQAIAVCRKRWFNGPSTIFRNSKSCAQISSEVSSSPGSFMKTRLFHHPWESQGELPAAFGPRFLTIAGFIAMVPTSAPQPTSKPSLQQRFPLLQPFQLGPLGRWSHVGHLEPSGMRSVGTEATNSNNNQQERDFLKKQLEICPTKDNKQPRPLSSRASASAGVYCANMWGSKSFTRNKYIWFNTKNLQIWLKYVIIPQPENSSYHTAS